MIARAKPAEYILSGTGEPSSLPSGEYLQISLAADGHVQIRGTSTAVKEFLSACARAGLVLGASEVHWCG